MNKRYLQRYIMYWLTLPLLLGSLFAHAQEKEMMAEMWVMTPKAGMEQAFEDALKKHTAHRVELGDPRNWNIYTPILGDNLNTYIIRSCCYEWKDMDSYREWTRQKNPMKHWREHAEDKVAHYGHYLSVLDFEKTNWPNETKANYVGVTDYKVKVGHWRMMMDDLETLNKIAKEKKWPGKWSWSYSVSGERSVSLAIPYEDYSSMAPPETKFSALVAEYFGSEEKIKAFWESWLSHFESTEYNIYVHRTDLSGKQDK